MAIHCEYGVNIVPKFLINYGVVLALIPLIFVPEFTEVSAVVQ
ncbi:hypothetical protein BMETH_1848_0 [methanotrophic bacterial endosymbiont of Bathymodiolus sp.]|nr:hypothetical protein BMETH_1848_0 [methanotrophic bacterial endosymbiont of Bathymodiolus sp.]